MTEREVEKMVSNLTEKLNKARARRDLVTVINITNKIKKLREEFIIQERTNMRNELDKLPETQKRHLFRKIQRIQLSSDFIQGLIVDFRDELRNVDKELQAIFLDGLESGTSSIQKFLKKTIADFDDEELNEDFCELSDSLARIMMNEIYKHEAILINQHKLKKA